VVPLVREVAASKGDKGRDNIWRDRVELDLGALPAETLDNGRRLGVSSGARCDWL
jgi:hypothetical protein